MRPRSLPAFRLTILSPAGAPGQPATRSAARCWQAPSRSSSPRSSALVPRFRATQLNWPVANGELILGIPVTAAPTAATYFVGEVSHFLDGVFFALLFALLFHPLVPLRNTLLGNLIKALLYGTVLGLISAAWWVPAVYVPHHAGFLSTSLGWKLTFGIFLWHWIYGYFLGTVYSPQPQDRPEAVPEQSSAPETETIHAATPGPV